MSNIDLSLDDIIKKKRTGGFRPNRNQGRGGGGAGAKFTNARQGIGKRLNRPNPTQNTGRQIPDARLKIIVKQRAKVKDARDRLNSIAKMTDARQKLQKIQAARNVQIGRQAQGMGSLASRGNNSNLQVGNQRQQYMRYQSPLSIINKHVLGRSIQASPKSKVSGGRLSGRLGAFRQLSSSSTGPLTSSNMRSTAPNAKRVVVGSSGIRITTANDDLNKRDYDDDGDEDEEDDDDVPMDEDLEHVSIGRLPDFKRLKSAAVQSSVSGSTTLSRINARLQSQSRSTTESLSPLQGFKVTVSNLQPSVTQDDILELFNEIGALRKASLVKRGLAEVVFFKSSDAQKACEAYHNRQLDGKPMCVTLVTPIPQGTQTKSSAASSPWLRVGGLRSDNMTLPSSSPAVPRNRISPDIEIIRKALFHKSVAAV